MRDWLDGALLEQQAIEEERGVVISELTGGNLVRERLRRQVFDLIMPDTLIVKRWVIGTEESLKTVAPDEFIEFYSEYYTPERATVVVTGAIDVDEMEARIVEAFSNATNPESPGAEPDLGTVTSGSGFQTAVFTDDEFKYREIYLYTVQPFVSEPDTKDKRTDGYAMSIANRVLKKRFDDIIRSEGSPISYGNSVASSLDPVNIYYVTVDAVEGQFEDAVEVLEQEFRRFIKYGLTRQEYEEAKAVYLNAFERAVEGADTRESSSLANSLSSSVNSRSVFSTPEENLEIVIAAFDSLTPELVHEEFLEVWDTEDIALVYLTKEQFENTTAILEATYNASSAVPVDPPMEEGNITFAYTDFGEPGTVISDTLQEDLAVRQLILSNNVRVNLK